MKASIIKSARSSILTILLICHLSILSGQPLTKSEILDLKKEYQQRFDTKARPGYDPLVLFVVDCSNTDSLFFGVSAIVQQRAFDQSLVDFYLEVDDEYILFRLNKYCIENCYLKAVKTNDSLFLRNKLVSDQVYISRVSHTLIYTKVKNEKPVLIKVVEDKGVDKKYWHLLP